MPDPFANMSPAQLAEQLRLRVFEANLLAKALTLSGTTVRMDVVDRPGGVPEILVGPLRYPAGEPDREAPRP